MLNINTNLKAKDVYGKKYRSSAFGVSAVFSIPFVIMAIFVSAIIPDREGRGVIIALIMIILLALPVALLLNSRKTSYIIGKEKLYFFDAQVKRPKNKNRKRERYVWTSGSVDYSDIKDFRYLNLKIDRYPRKPKYIMPPRVVVIGDDLEVEIYAFKSLIKRIKELQ